MSQIIDDIKISILFMLVVLAILLLISIIFVTIGYLGQNLSKLIT